MVIGVISDTHGNRVLMQRIAAQILKLHRADLLLHLGDDYADGEELSAGGFPVRYVPGLWCDEYGNGRTPKVLMDTYEGLTLAFAHAREDLHKSAGHTAQLQCVGHTHQAAVVRQGKSLLINPGHLKSRTDRGQRASYAIVDLGPETVRAAIHELDGKIRQELTVLRADL